MELLQPELSAQINVQQKIRKAVCVSSASILCGVQFFGQGPVLSAKYSAEVLDGLVSAVSRWWD